MVRNVLGAGMALAAAAALLISPFLDWFAGQPGRDIRLLDLFETGDLGEPTAGLLTGLAVPMVVITVVAVVGVVLRSRLLVGLAGVLALGLTVLWMVRRYLVTDSLLIGGEGVNAGALTALGAGVGLLLAAVVMAGRRQPAVAGRHARTAREPERTAPEPEPYPETYPEDARTERQHAAGAGPGGEPRPTQEHPRWDGEPEQQPGQREPHAHPYFSPPRRDGGPEGQRPYRYPPEPPRDHRDAA
ncbi:hypothetical protein [Streptomyces aidingensis]|uniref:Tryptophan-associated transmembrane protein (Trp_oprn_chp) n=1 Tax=Streptomyces aidingensis TaxID=910347 RepID=A0A1I1HGE7_9ACTN|nr:hypothetical protein [Streptomyces aidingensis]SFC20543.1 hypothetical protein SAMN05421773_102303 [Streptomyces aidingensis]